MPWKECSGTSRRNVVVCDGQQSSTLAIIFTKDRASLSLSSRSPANFECRRWSTYASYCTLHGRGSQTGHHLVAEPSTSRRSEF